MSSYAKVPTADRCTKCDRGSGERTGTAGLAVLRRHHHANRRLAADVGGYLQSTIASEFNVNPLPGWAWTLIFLAVVALVLYFGVRISSRVQLVVALISVVVVTVFFCPSS